MTGNTKFLILQERLELLLIPVCMVQFRRLGLMLYGYQLHCTVWLKLRKNKILRPHFLRGF